MKFRNWFLSFAVLAGLAATAAEAVPEPEKTPAAEAGASAPALELPAADRALHEEQRPG